jgi:hypothetical protein
MNAYVYVLSCPLGLVKVGVAADPKQRLRNLQIGSPVPLELAAQYAMSDRPSARSATGRRRRASRPLSGAPANEPPARPPPRPPRNAAAVTATPGAVSGARTQAFGPTCKLAGPNCGAVPAATRPRPRSGAATLRAGADGQSGQPLPVGSPRPARDRERQDDREHGREQRRAHRRRPRTTPRPADDRPRIAPTDPTRGGLPAARTAPRSWAASISRSVSPTATAHPISEAQARERGYMYRSHPSAFVLKPERHRPWFVAKEPKGDVTPQARAQEGEGAATGCRAERGYSRRSLRSRPCAQVRSARGARLRGQSTGFSTAQAAPAQLLKWAMRKQPCAGERRLVATGFEAGDPDRRHCDPLLMLGRARLRRIRRWAVARGAM